VIEPGIEIEEAVWDIVVIWGMCRVRRLGRMIGRSGRRRGEGDKAGRIGPSRGLYLFGNMIRGHRIQRQRKSLA
jgi:hypothetical protein